MEKPQNSSFRVLWITQNYPPSKGGMSESCDRIVYNLRQSGLVIDVLHLFERATHAKDSVPDAPADCAAWPLHPF
jgi:hypothetical protein